MSIPIYSSPGLPSHVDLDLSRNEGSRFDVDLVRLVDDPEELIRRYPDTAALRSRLAARVLDQLIGAL